MSDSESAPAAPHPTLGGKSLQSLERPRYKSWRKKYRKMRSRFDGMLEDNKRLFKEEQKLECIAKRLREELDGLLDLCLDLNQSPAIPPEHRFNVSYKENHSQVPDNITPEQANDLLQQYTAAFKDGHVTHIQLYRMREQIDERLAEQETEPLSSLEASVPHAIPSAHLPEDLKGDDPPGYLTPEQEGEYLLRLDAKLGDTYSLTRSAPEQAETHWAELTPRELERQMELLNPQSQHNWLKNHTKLHPANLGGAEEDNESIASHDKPAARKRANNSKNLAKQVGDRAVERAREGWSPGAGSAMGEEDELGLYEEGLSGSGRKRGRDPDGTYRVKGGRSGGKGKRKRSGEDFGGEGKRAKVEGE